MEDLALIVSLIVLAIIVLGLLSFITVLRTPRSRAGRFVTLFINTCGVMSGVWFATLDIGLGARVIGVAVAAASAVSATRLLRQKAR